MTTRRQFNKLAATAAVGLAMPAVITGRTFGQDKPIRFGASIS